MPKHVFQVFIRTSQDALWNALTDPEITRKYLSGARLRGELAKGAPYAYRLDDGTPTVTGEIVELDPPRRLVMTFAFAGDEFAGERPSRVTYEIEPMGPSCRLTVVHDDFHGVTRSYAEAGRGWPEVVSGLKTLLETGSPLEVDRGAALAPDAEPVDAEREDHRAFGASAHNRVWELLGRDDRTPADDREMVDAAHASLWHWRYAGTLVNEQRGEWLVSHVRAVLGDGDAALAHARRCWALTETGALDGFDYAYACEAMARAHAARGDVDDARAWRDRASTAATKVSDPEDREIVDADLAAGPWYGLP
jgi:uncharacterized protein YndB with AHSA1/START domain